MRWALLFFLCSTPLRPQAAPESWTQTIERLLASGKLDQARERIEQEKTARGETPPVAYFEARILFEERRYAEALKILQRSLATAPPNPELYKLAALSAIRMDRLDIAESALKKAEELAPNDYLIHFHLGALWYTKSLFRDAKPELEEAARLNPNYMPALLFLGLTMEEIEDEETTVATYRKAVEVAAGQHNASEMPYVYLGRFYYRMNRFDEGLPLLEKAVQINPGSAEGLLELGKTLHALNRDNEAISVLQRAGAADESNPEPHYLLFRIFESQSREVAAHEELQRFQARKTQTRLTDASRRRLQNTQ